MTEKHYVDSKDQRIAAEGAPTHAELTTMYPEVHKEVLGQWMQEDARQAVMEKDRRKIVSGLRKSALLVGVCISLPVVLGILLGQFAITQINPTNEIALVFLLFFLLAGLSGLTYSLFKWVGQTFRNHTLRSLPITLTTLLSLFFLIRPTFHYFNLQAGGLEGYAFGLIALLVMGTVIATVSIIIWTIHWIPALVKIVVLLVFFAAAVAAAYLA